MAIPATAWHKIPAVLHRYPLHRHSRNLRHGVIQYITRRRPTFRRRYRRCGGIPCHCHGYACLLVLVLPQKAKCEEKSRGEMEDVGAHARARRHSDASIRIPILDGTETWVYKASPTISCASISSALPASVPPAIQLGGWEDFRCLHLTDTSGYRDTDQDQEPAGRAGARTARYRGTRRGAAAPWAKACVP